MPKSARDVSMPLKRAFLRGAIRMAQEDATDVKHILVLGGFVKPNSDGSIDLVSRNDGSVWFRECLLNQQTLLALALLVRVQRWERLQFRRHLDAGIPAADALLAHIEKTLRSRKPSAQLATWLALRWQVYRDHCAWLTDQEMVVHWDRTENSDHAINAIADFLIAATQKSSTNTKRR